MDRSDRAALQPREVISRVADALRLKEAFVRLRRPVGATALAIVVAGCGPTVPETSSSPSPVPTAEGPSTPGNPYDHVDGCPDEPFQVYTQNRWAPQGAVVRAVPSIDSEIIGRYAGNVEVSVDGWLETGVAAYPDNPSDFQGSVWFRLADRFPNDPDGIGWVTSAAIRAVPTEFDRTGRDYGGTLASEPRACAIGQ